MKIYLLVACLAVTLPLLATAQICDPQIPAATPDRDFILRNDGNTIHIPTGLMWSRCSIGQTWNGTTCIDGGALGDNYFVWQDSLKKADSVILAGFDDWRLPNIKELASLVETACKQPAINLTVFPNTPVSEVYWTSTPSSFPANQAWYISFYGGAENNYVKSNLNRVRVVRTVTEAF